MSQFQLMQKKAMIKNAPLVHCLSNEIAAFCGSFGAILAQGNKNKNEREIKSLEIKSTLVCLLKIGQKNRGKNRFKRTLI